MQCANRARIPPRHALSLSAPALFVPARLPACCPPRRSFACFGLSHTHTCKSKTGRLRVARKASAHFIYVACCANYDATVDRDGNDDCDATSFCRNLCHAEFFLVSSRSLALAGVNFRLLFEITCVFFSISKNFCLILDLSCPHAV